MRRTVSAAASGRVGGMKEGESEAGLRRATPGQPASVCVSASTEKVVQLTAATAPTAGVQSLGAPGSGAPDTGTTCATTYFQSILWMIWIDLIGFDWI